MPDAAPFLAAIASDPDDDLPRLVFADWLDEHGDADRGEFIRLQCHTARVGPLDPTWAPAKLREYDLFRANEAAWRPGGRDDVSHMLTARWHRGFPACIDMGDMATGRFRNGEWCNGAFHWTARPGGRFDPWPKVGPVREVRFSGWRPGCGGILHTEQLRTVRAISLMEWYAGVNPGSIENFAGELAQLPPGHFPELTTLDLDQGELNLPALEALAAAPCLRSVKGLHLRFPSDMLFTELRSWEAAVSRLFVAVARHLEVLAVERLSPILAAQFARVRWPELSRLTIAQRGSVGLDAFASADLPKLSALQFALQTHTPGQTWTAALIDTVARWPALRTVRALGTGGISDLMMKRFLAAAGGATFRYLSANVGRHDTLPFRLAELGQYPCLRELNALAGAFNYSDLAGLSDPHVLPQLHTVWNVEPVAFPHSLRWSGGTRTLLSRDTETPTHPTRSHWCGWSADLLG